MRYPHYFLLTFLLFLNLAFQGDDSGLESTADFVYGHSIQFQLAAQDIGAVNEVRLFVQFQEAESPLEIQVPFTVNQLLQAEYVLDLTQFPLAPNSAVTYWWILKTDGGEVLTPSQALVYADNRLPWQKMSQNGVTVFWIGNGPFFGQTILDITQETFAALNASLRLQGLTPFAIYVYPTTAERKEALRLVGEAPDETPDPAWGVILVTADNPTTAADDLRQSIPYEVTRMLLYQAAGDQYDRLPLWLVEGLALSKQSQSNPRYAELLETAVITRAHLPFAQLCYSWPSDADDRALLAEAQSVSLLAMIEARYGATAVRDLVQVYAAGADCADGVTKVLGMNLAELDQFWFENAQPQAPLVQFLDAYALWILLLCATFGITGLLIWQNLRQRHP